MEKFFPQNNLKLVDSLPVNVENVIIVIFVFFLLTIISEFLQIPFATLFTVNVPLVGNFDLTLANNYRWFSS